MTSTCSPCTRGDARIPSHYNVIFTIDGKDYATTFLNKADQPRGWNEDKQVRPF